MSLTMADYGTVCTPGRSSARLKARKVFNMPSRDEVLGKIQVDRTPHKSLDHFRPRKLIHDFVKGHNRYNNTDPVSLWEDGAMSDFIVDDEEEVGEEESDDTASSAESQSNDSGDEEEEESSDDDVKRGRKNTTSEADHPVLRKRRKSKQISSSDESGKESTPIKESHNLASKVESDRNRRARRNCVSKRRVVSTTKVKVDNNHNERIKGKVGNVKIQDNGDVDELEDEESLVTLRRGHRKKKSQMVESSEDDIGSGENEQEDTDEEDQINRPHRKRKKTIESSDESDGDERQVSSPTTTQHKRTANRRHHYELRGTCFPKDKTQTVEKNLSKKSCQKKMHVEASGREAGSDSDEELSFNTPRSQRRKRRAIIESSEDDLDSGEKEQEETDENKINKPPRKMKAIESSDESDGNERQVSSSTTMQHKRAANRRHHYELRGTRFPKDKTQTVEENLSEKSCQKKMPVEDSGREAGSDSDEELSFNTLRRGQRRKRRATIESSEDDLDSGEKETEETDEENQINKPHRKMKKAIESSDESDGDECQVSSPTTMQHKRTANRRHHYELRGTRSPKVKTQTVEKNSLENSCQKKMPVEASGREAGSDSDEELTFNVPRGKRRKRRATIESSDDDDHDSGGEDE